MTSFFSFSARIAFSIFSLFSSRTASIAALVSFTICPTFGLSSGATSFIPFNTAVSSPFLPRNFTRTSFSFSGISADSIAFNASSLMFCSFSFIIFFLSFNTEYLQNLPPAASFERMAIKKVPSQKGRDIKPVVPP